MDMDSFEDILELAGNAGPWQLRTFLLSFFAGFPAALQDFLYIFIAATPDHWCKIPSCDDRSYEELKNFTIPIVTMDGKSAFSSCSRYAVNWNVSLWDEACGLPDSRPNRTIACTGYEFDHSTFESTIATEWGLVCDNEFWRSTSQAVYFLGGLCGSLVFGVVSDNYGRKRAVVLSALLCAVFGPIVALSPTFTIFLVARFFLSAGSPGLFDITHVLVLETVGPKWRGLAGNLFSIPYGFGYAGSAAFAYWFRNWRHLQLAVTAPVLVFLSMIYFVPESPRWLISQGHAKKGEMVLRAIAEENGKTEDLPSNFSEHVAKLASQESNAREGKESSSSSKISQFTEQLVSLFRTPKIRRRTLALNFCWFATVLVYYGGAFNAHNLSANLFLYTLVSGLLEIPSYLIIPPLIKHLGRRMVFSASFFLCAAALSMSLIFEPGTIPVISLAWFAIFCIGASYSLIFVYGAEVMPTSVRSYGLGIAAVVGRGGSLGGLYATDLLGQIEKMAPTMVLVFISLAAGFVALLLPETNKQKLPETVEDVENSEDSVNSKT